ncbi:MAG: leucyl/phenylalanyl-tRNA--protein transferase [Verrucomicrobiales bacterium]
MMESLSPEVLLHAYSQGVFPMAEEGELLWFSPRQRGVIPLDERFHVPKGLRRSLKKNRFEVRVDYAFEEVMLACADRSETWIDDQIIASYTRLFELGYGHCFECWDDEGLQGGLYGVALGRAFFGESMFSRKTDASKIALVHLVEWLRKGGYTLLDTQWMTDHLRQFGGYEIPRDRYLYELSMALSNKVLE